MLSFWLNLVNFWSILNLKLIKILKKSKQIFDHSKHFFLKILLKIIKFEIKKGDDEHKRPARMQPLNSESILTKEQLFDMFQQILGVKKFEHQILFNALMVS